MAGTAVAIIGSSILRTCGHQQFHEVALRPPVNLTISARPDMRLLADDSSFAVITGLACESSPPRAPAAYDNLIDRTHTCCGSPAALLGLTQKREKNKTTLPNISVIRRFGSVPSQGIMSEPEGAAEPPLSQVSEEERNQPQPQSGHLWDNFLSP